MKKIVMIVALLASAVLVRAQDQKSGHVNFTEIVQLMPEMDSARANLEVAQKDANDTYQGMVAEYNSKAEQYQQKNTTWTPAVRESKERELNEIAQRISDFERSIQQELAQLQQSLMIPIQQKAVDTVKKIAKAKGLVYVFDTSSLLYYDESKSVDLTADAKAELGIPADKVLPQLQ